MNTKRIVLSAIIAALPFSAMAENISGAMYVAPAAETNLTPAPTTNAYFPYGRINIDTDDQEHIATTAYVKGAYNSAIAAVNKTTENVLGYVNDELDGLNYELDGKQDRLLTISNNDPIDTYVLDEFEFNAGIQDLVGGVGLSGTVADDALVTAKAVVTGMQTYVNSKTVPIYTTWDTNNTTNVHLQ